MTQVFPHSGSQARQLSGECQDAIEFVGVANCAPARMIAVLFTAARISPCCLQMSTGVGTDPYVFPRWRDGETVDALDYASRTDSLAPRPNVDKAPGIAKPPQSGRGTANIAQSCQLGGSSIPRY